MKEYLVEGMHGVIFRVFWKELSVNLVFSWLGYIFFPSKHYINMIFFLSEHKIPEQLHIVQCLVQYWVGLLLQYRKEYEIFIVRYVMEHWVYYMQERLLHLEVVKMKRRCHLFDRNVRVEKYRVGIKGKELDGIYDSGWLAKKER